MFRITLKVYIECDCPEDSPCYTNECGPLRKWRFTLLRGVGKTRDGRTSVTVKMGKTRDGTVRDIYVTDP